MKSCYRFNLGQLGCCYTGRGLGSFTFARARREDVLASYRRLEEATGISPDRIVRANLDNGLKVARVREGDAGRGVLREPGHLQGVDAIYTNVPNLYISLSTADCFSLVLYDRRHQAVGIAHCGWRGIAGRLEEKLLQAMITDFGTESPDVLAVIGPGIQACCYFQHDDGLRNAFADYSNLALIKEQQDGTYSIDIALVLRANLASLGITALVDTKLCTGCNHDFYSARREGFATGRLLNLAAVTNKL